MRSKRPGSGSLSIGLAPHTFAFCDVTGAAFQFASPCEGDALVWLVAPGQDSYQAAPDSSRLAMSVATARYFPRAMRSIGFW